MKHIVIIFLVGIMLSSCQQSVNFQQNNINLSTSPMSTNTPTTNTNDEQSKKFVSLTTKDGEIVLELFSSKAPNTVANFISKSQSGFYKNLIFHRVIPGFMAQGGDPTGTGSGGGRQKSELNSIPFKRGTIGLARTAETKEVSNDSQFFICFSTEGCQHLTSDYVNFGEVISGFEVLDKVSQGDKIIDIKTTTK